MYTREQIKELENIGQTIKHFATTIQSGFKRGSLSSEDNAVADIYEAATNTKVDRNFGCKSCNYNFYKKAAELYYESKKFYEEEDKAEDEIVEMVTALHDEEVKRIKKPVAKKTATKKTAKKK